ncbi:MAG: hypothetical protein HY360_26680 [Verrucomicrobia bacterium]|nr:hypothetical protein [Verrucomicrobiota bacterium]
MKTTVEIPDELFRHAKARAALAGQSMKGFFVDALRNKIHSVQSKSRTPPGWRSVFGKAPKGAAAEVQGIVDEEFSRIDAESWK